MWIWKPEINFQVSSSVSLHLIFYYYFMCVGNLPVCMSVCGACRDQKRALGAMERWLLVTMWVPAT